MLLFAKSSIVKLYEFIPDNVSWCSLCIISDLDSRTIIVTLSSFQREA